MKTIVILVLGLCTILCSCDPISNNDDPGLESLIIYKFKDSIYKDYILTNQYEGYDYFSMSVYDDALPDGRWETMKGKYPYHELKNDYILLDWRWRPCNLPVVIFEPHTSHENWLQRWPLETPHDIDPVVESYSIAAEALDYYTNNLKYQAIYYRPYITRYASNEEDDSHKKNPITNEDMSWNDLENFYDAYYQELVIRLDSLIEKEGSMNNIYTNINSMTGL